MSFLSEIREVSPRHVTDAVLSVAATVGIGTLTLFQFQRRVFVSLDWFRFTLLAISIPLPSLLVNTTLLSLFAYTLGKRTSMDNNIQGSYRFACLYSALTFAVGLYLSFWLQWQFLGFAQFMLASHLLVLIAVVVALRRAKQAARSAATAQRDPLE